MSALEREIIERLKQLDERSKHHVLEVVKLEQTHATEPTDGAILGTGTLKDLLDLRAYLQETHGEIAFPSATDLLREIRDEES